MPLTVIPLASHFLTGSILSLVMPVGLVILILIWYTVVWRRGSEDRAERHRARREET